MDMDISPVQTSRQGEIGLIALDNPPVNALGAGLRQGLVRAIEELNVDPDIRVIALFGAGRSLSSGADISEFGKPPVPPRLSDVLDGIEASATPVVAVLHGPTLGGGLELALAAQARVALPGATLGLPEVTLGLIPGAGGTQRLPRLIALESAIDLVTSGRKVSVEEALALGIVDRVMEAAPREAALAAAQALLSGDLATRRTGEIALDPDPQILTAARNRLGMKRPALPAMLKALDAIAASGRPIAEGIAVERAFFNELRKSPERQGLVHAFNAERAVRKIPEANETPRHIDSAGVIGGGTMGVGIATALIRAGVPVTLIETAPEHAEAARAAVAKNLAGAVKRGKLTPEARDALMVSLTAATDLAALAPVDLVVEAVFEDMAVKIDIFGKLDNICKPGAVLGTNTSYLDVNEIAAATARPEDVIGLHFFSPAHIMRLLEVVVADRTAPDTVATAFALAARMKKVAVRSGVCDGFIGNRILAHYRKAADYMLLDGASFEQIDRALESFGFAMGPFAVGDLAGLDIGWATRKRKAPTRPPEERHVAIADRICEQGWFGRKTGKGYYLYETGSPCVPNPQALAIVASERQASGITPRAFSDDEIVARYMTAMICEAARVVEDGIALRPIDVDAVMLFGYGFPRHLGGVLNYADRIGAAALVADIECYSQEDPHYWQVPALLRGLAEHGRDFAGMNKE